MNTKLSSFLCVLVLITLLIVVCDYKDISADSESPKIRQIAVMPFLKGKRPDNIDTLMICNPKQLYIESDEFSPEAEHIMTRVLNQAMTSRYGQRMISQTDVDVAYNNIEVDSGLTTLQLAIKLGKDLNAGYVVIGNVWKFRNRSGSALASEQGATVALNLHLIDIDKGTRIWKGTFVKTQLSLSDDFFQALDFFKQGAKWLTAEDLARYGVNKTLKQFPLKN
ncbi:MAG: hypothetical protein K9L30_14460 [Desulfobacterales bacterium]|nr:hypothetical protein [Desulfobacterales bacterium]